VKAAAKLAKLDQFETRYIEKEPSAFDAFLAGMTQSRIGGFFARQGWLSPLGAFSERPNRELMRLQGLLKQHHPGLPVSVQAHCECGIN
jgi:hypothetical protein